MQIENGDFVNTKVISIGEVVRNVNNVALGEDIVVFDHDTAFRSNDFFPMRIDALMIALCTSGHGSLGVDLREYELTKNSLIVIQPKNYIHSSYFTDDFRCAVVVCSKHIIEDVIPKLTDILPLLLHHRTEPITQLTDDEAEGINYFYAFLQNKLSGPKTPFLKQKVMCGLQATLYEMMDISCKNNSEGISHKSRKEEIMAKFILAVSEEFREQRQVAYYSDKLCISPKHLSSVVKEISGKTAGDWIEHYVIMEAKVLLKTTDLTIQEIANRLNFTNQSFFGKYFKHHTGNTPTDYRRQFG